MKRLIICLFLLIIVPVFAYEVYNSKDYTYTDKDETLLFVIDFSNSMSEHLEHKTKTTQIKSLMQKILPQISPDVSVGMRVYGHTCNVLAFNACRSSELIVPLAKNNSQKINNAIAKLRPKGMTPITYSLKQAVKKDLINFDGLKHIILLTDGGENCDESPCEYAIDLMKTRKDIKIDVIAFDVHDKNDLDQLRCTADVTGGSFVEARTNAQLFNFSEELILPHKNVEAVLFNSSLD